MDAALAYRHLLGARSEVSDSHRNCEKVQDPYSLRCQPQVMGACLTQIRQPPRCWKLKPTPSPITRWCSPNRATCCPAATSAEPVAMAADNWRWRFAEIGLLPSNASLMMDKHMSQLPPFGGERRRELRLHDRPVTAAALASENKALAHPSSVDSIPTSANREDHVSMAPAAGRRLWTWRTTCAAFWRLNGWLPAGADFRNGLKTSEGLEQARRLLRACQFLRRDRFFAPDIEAASQLLAAGHLIAAACGAAA
ncbi:aromatic amino acid lyase [Serratia marcescens]|uniref:Aromatic amino acid lyase n=1 Tax=Serratia marcescens TaxID=615 RepID=A0A939NMR6_SERMA|nr:aromatic amino acid lyase [Serratia marcescens]